MAAGNFQRCNAVTRKWEGGYSNHPSDPGGKTMNGVTEAVFHEWLRSKGLPLRLVKTITPVETDSLFKELYWNKCKAEDLFPGVDLSVYDASVNSGVSRGLKWLVASIGGAPSDTVKRINAARSSAVQGFKGFKVFGKGWMNRIADIEAISLRMVLEASGVSRAKQAEVLKEEASTASAKSAVQATAATTTSATSGGALSAGNVSDFGLVEKALAVGLGVALIVLTAVIAYNAYRNFVRSRAMKRLA